MTTETEATTQPFVETLKLAAYAPTGGRKTLQIGYLIDRFGAENVGIISAEHGLRTIASKVDERYVKRVDNRADLREAWAWANDNFNSADKWVCVDGGTRVLNWIQAEIFGGAQAALEAILAGTPRNSISGNLRKYVPYVSKDLDFQTQQMWWQTGQQAERLLDSFIKIGSNMYWTFWEDQTSLSQYVKGPPWIPDTPGKGALSAVKGAFDFIFRLVSNGDNTTAHFRNGADDNTNYCKTRDDWDGGLKVPDKIPNFNLADFVELIQPPTTKPTKPTKETT